MSKEHTNEEKSVFSSEEDLLTNLVGQFHVSFCELDWVVTWGLVRIGKLDRELWDIALADVSIHSRIKMLRILIENTKEPRDGWHDEGKKIINRIMRLNDFRNDLAHDLTMVKDDKVLRILRRPSKKRGQSEVHGWGELSKKINSLIDCTKDFIEFGQCVPKV